MNPDSTPEIFDIVDEADHVVGQAPRNEVHRRGLRHRAVHVLLFNERGELFLQKRAATKDTFPRCWDSSASGHLNAGEDYDACAVREVYEEIGLTLAPQTLRKTLRLAACAETSWEFVWVYTVVGPQQPVINPAEIERGEFWPLPRVLSLVQQQPAQCAASFVRIVHEFKRQRLWPNC